MFLKTFICKLPVHLDNNGGLKNKYNKNKVVFADICEWRTFQNIVMCCEKFSKGQCISLTQNKPIKKENIRFPRVMGWFIIFIYRNVFGLFVNSEHTQYKRFKLATHANFKRTLWERFLLAVNTNRWPILIWHFQTSSIKYQRSK